MPERRMALIAISFASGILAAGYVSLPVCLIAAAVALFAAAAVVRRWPRTAVAAGAIAFALGGFRYAADCWVASDDISRLRATAFEGVVASDPDARTDRVQLVLAVERARTFRGWVAASGQVMVSLHACDGGEIPAALEYGDRARIIAYCYSPMEPTNPGQFSYKDYLARQGIHSCASVRNADQVVALAGQRGNLFVRAALAAKRHLEDSIQRIHPRREASVIIGMVLGTYSYLPSETFRNFTRSGTLHLLAASGYNCWILVFLATPVLSVTGLLPKHRRVILIVLLAVYLVMVGLKPSLVRAAVMAGLWLAASLVRRVPNIRALFFTAGLAALIIHPSDLFEVGFQLSFLAVWALLTVAPVIESMLARAGLIGVDTGRFPPRHALLLRKITAPMAAAAVGTAAVTLVTAPIVAQYFNYVSLVSLPANMVLALGVPVVFADGLLSPVAGLLTPIGAIARIGTVTTDWMLRVVDYFGSGRYSAVSVASPGAVAIAGYYLLLYAGLVWVRSRHAQR